MWLEVLLVEYVGHRLLFRRDLHRPPGTSGQWDVADVPLAVVRLPVVPVLVVGLMPVAFAALSPLGGAGMGGLVRGPGARRERPGARTLPAGDGLGALALVALVATLLANLLWRRTLLARGEAACGRDFHVLSALVTLPAVGLGVLVLGAWAPLVR